MKKLLFVLIIVLLATPAMSAIFTDDFDDPALAGWLTSGDGLEQDIDSVDGTTTFASLGWWWYDWMWKDTGEVYQANTLYTLTVRARDGGDGLDPASSTSEINGAFGSVELGFYRTDTLEKLNDYVNNPAAGYYGYHSNFTFDSTPGVFGDGSPWYEYSVTLNTADFPAAVGTGIGVNLAAVNGNVAAAWTSFDSVVVTPEPATIALLGLGGLVLRRKR